MRPSPRLSALSCLPLLLVSTSQALSVQRRAASSSSVDGLSTSKTNLIKDLLNTTATKTWEIGTHLQALTEYDYPALAPFYTTFTPPPSTPVASSVLAIISPIVAAKSSSSLQIMPDGSLADPASMGVAVVLANWTSEGATKDLYESAAEEQLQALLVDTPRTDSGAISHRVEELALWSDFVYMVPPFLAYYGVVNDNTSLIQEAYTQCELYRRYLRTPETGLWRHIIWGSSPDDGLWATGNGWAAAGMLRVVATIINSPFAEEYSAQTAGLTSWVVEIVEAAFKTQRGDNLFYNYLNETSTFGDAASAALLSSVSYRLAQLGLSNSTLSAAEATRSALYLHISSSTGILSPVVDPLSYGSELSASSTSPEAEAFVLLMESAWRDWKEMSDQPGNGGSANGNTDESAANAATPTSWGVRGGASWFGALVTALGVVWVL
ncbi:Six-hairpin glycosidase-like protein [Leucosporidium creatinivorum]|uniref:Six-hairpin glycosidase-like protein n=1 Tax=Leucosporidium creatinivorum TaxID=106004 RepID=A0A1Y2CFL8_9BASI|nr:Six-hairpin glycosidase-like protein [Leucosporidium creatinivorum]